MTSGDQFFDNTRISSFLTCPRMYYYRHVRHWKPAGVALPLAFGAAWHTAMDYVWDTKIHSSIDEKVAEDAYRMFLDEWQDQGLEHPNQMDAEDLDTMLPRTPLVAQEMLYHYVALRASFISDPDLEIIEIEQPFAVPLDPNDPNLFYCGRRDKAGRKNGKITVYEHKTTAYYKKNGPFREVWLESFDPNRQIMGYMYSARMEWGNEFKEVWIDGALVHKTVHDGFRWIPMPLHEDKLDLWLWQTLNSVREIQSNVEALRNVKASDSYMASFEQRFTQCIQYNRLCPYHDICVMHPNPVGLDTPEGFEESPWSPFDELELSRIGLEREAA